MTREEAIEYLDKLYMKANITDVYGDMDDTEPYEEAIDMAIDALEAQQWVPCSERLPWKSDVYLICDKDSLVYVAYFTHKGEWVADDVVAWMPLPKAYRKEE